LILLVTNSSYSFSQTDTTKVIITTPTARLVIKDLIQGDSYKLELEAVYGRVRVYEQKIEVQDSIINTQDLKIKNYVKLVEIKDLEIQENNKLILSLKQDLRKAEIKQKLTAAISSAGIGLLVVLHLL